jgi:hypothetical protein
LRWYEIVIAYQLHAFAERVGELLPAFGVGLAEAILDAPDGGTTQFIKKRLRVNPGTWDQWHYATSAP